MNIQVTTVGSRFVSHVGISQDLGDLPELAGDNFELFAVRRGA